MTYIAIFSLRMAKENFRLEESSQHVLFEACRISGIVIIFFKLCLINIFEIVELGGAHDRQGDLSYAKSFID